MSKAKFIANWTIQGLGASSLQAEDAIWLDPEDEATQALIEAGALSRSEDEDAESASIDEMTKAELLAHAKKHHGVGLDPRLAKADLLAQVKAFAGEPALADAEPDEVDQRITELQAFGDDLSEDEKVELQVLLEARG